MTPWYSLTAIGYLEFSIIYPVIKFKFGKGDNWIQIEVYGILNLKKRWDLFNI